MGDGAQPAGATQHVGPIIFADETARHQLVKEGVVTTFRSSARTTGDTWWRASRTGEKRGDCHVRLATGVAPVPAELHPYVHHSGFESVEDWQAAIRDVNGQTPDRGYIYEVRER